MDRSSSSNYLAEGNSPKHLDKTYDITADSSCLNTKALEVSITDKIQEFSSWFNGEARKSLLTSDAENRPEIIYLLLTLKGHIKSALCEIGKSLKNVEQQFKCNKCQQILVVKPGENTGEVLQEHGHIDESLKNFLLLKPEIKQAYFKDKVFLLNSKSSKGECYDKKKNVAKTLPSEDMSLIMEKCNKSKENPQFQLDNGKKKMVNGSEISTPSVNLNAFRFNFEAQQKCGHSSTCKESKKPSNLELSSFSPPDLNSFRFNFQSENINDSSLNEPSTSREILGNSANGLIPASLSIQTSKKSPENSLLLTSSTLESSKLNVDKCHETVENIIYPENLMTQIRRIDKIRLHTIQKISSHSAACLICHCDLGNSYRVSREAIVSHCLGKRHLKSATDQDNLNALENYHKVWCKLEVPYQAHQVYFIPHTDKQFSCLLCKASVKKNDVIAHIQNMHHKKNVIQLYSGEKSIYLLDLQIQLYENVLLKPKGKDNDKLNAVAGNRNNVIQKETQLEKKEHNIVKSVENSNSADPFEKIPKRYRHHIPYLKIIVEPKMVFLCTICKGVVNTFTPDEITCHLAHPYHVSVSKYTPLKYEYYCEICNEVFGDEFAWNKHFVDGPNRHESIAQSRKQKVYEYECLSCKTVIYGDELSLQRHMEYVSRTQGKKKEMKLPILVTDFFKSRQFIEDAAEFLIQISNEALTSQEDDIKMCCRDLALVLSSKFLECTVYPFGSRISGLGTKSSDLDVFIDIGDMYNGVRKQDPQSQNILIRNAKDLFSSSNLFRDIRCIASARTPIIKLVHKAARLDCDISFRHGLSVENTKFLSYCFELQPITRKLILVLKKWSGFSKLNEYITNYAFAIMAIFYMQQGHYLLSVNAIRQLNPGKSLVIDDWDTIKYVVPPEKCKEFNKKYEFPFVKLLQDFFKFYIDFDYKTDVVCPLMGEVVKKSQFTEGNGEYLPEEMNSYINKLKHEEDPERFRALSEFCIQDPFDLSHNLTKACSSSTINKLKTFCQLTYDHLQKFN